jgi:NAD(P)-dependent dehydrogenase (short-subunit alcohol dehydrogenase family)
MSTPLRQLFDLSGRVAIVTGGSRGLGLEMAEGLAEAGASLMLCARRQQWLDPALEAMRTKGFRVEGQLCDVSDQGQVQAVVDATAGSSTWHQSRDCEDRSAARTTRGTRQARLA